MSALSTETTQPELSGLGVTPASGIWPASGIFLASGINVIIPQQISGVVGVSGEIHIMSGNVAVVSGAISVVSGEIHVMSGTIGVSGLFSNLSGAPLQSSATLIAPQFKRIMYPGLSGLYNTAASSVGFQSGGFALSSSVSNVVTVRNWSGNNPIFVGFSGFLPTSGGYGFVLYGGDGLTMDVGPNMNLVWVVAQTSGSLISHFAMQY